MTNIWSAEHIQIGISLLEDFERFPPHQFQQQPDGRLKHDPNLVNLFSDWKWFFDGEPYRFEYIVQDHDALIEIKRQLLSLPTFMSFDMIDKSHFPSKTKRFMVLINPKHSVIRKKMEKFLNQCLSYMEDDPQRFALELRLDDVIQNFCQKSEVFKDFRVPYDSKFICITNGGQRFQQIYRNPWCWVGLFPVALICGVPYCLCRSCTTEDIICQIVSNVTLIKHHDRHHSIDHFDSQHDDEEINDETSAQHEHQYRHESRHYEIRKHDHKHHEYHLHQKYPVHHEHHTHHEFSQDLHSVHNQHEIHHQHHHHESHHHQAHEEYLHEDVKL